MVDATKVSLDARIAGLQYLAARTPGMAFTGGAEKAFAAVAAYRDGAVYVGHYSGSSEWERHPRGDEIVMALAGQTSVVLLQHGAEQRIRLAANELLVVPRNTWHRFEGSSDLKVLSVTPSPTDHSLELPET